MTKYERAAKKLQEIKQALLSTCRNGEQLRELRDLQGKNDPETNNIHVGDVPVSASVFSETSHVYFDPAGCISYCFLDFLQSPRASEENLSARLVW